MGLVGSYPCVGDKIASVVLVFYFGVALGSGSNTQALYILNIKKNKNTTRQEGNTEEALQLRSNRPCKWGLASTGPFWTSIQTNR